MRKFLAARWEDLILVNYEIELSLDFGQTYGPEFDFLTRQKPYSVLLAKGSEISVYKGAILR